MLSLMIEVLSQLLELLLYEGASNPTGHTILFGISYSTDNNDVNIVTYKRNDTKLIPRENCLRPYRILLP